MYHLLIEEGWTEEDAKRIVDDGDYFTIEGESEEDIGYYLVEEGFLGEIPEAIVSYIDYERLGTDYCWNYPPFYKDGIYIFLHY